MSIAVSITLTNQITGEAAQFEADGPQASSDAFREAMDVARGWMEWWTPDDFPEPATAAEESP